MILPPTLAGATELTLVGAIDAFASRCDGHFCGRCDADLRSAAPIPPSADQAPPELVNAAIDAVKQWEFDGTLLNCVPVEVEMTVSVGFDPKERP